jgi:hypothetical protein
VLEDWKRVGRLARGAERDARGRAVGGRMQVVGGGCMCVRGEVHFHIISIDSKVQEVYGALLVLIEDA